MSQSFIINLLGGTVWEQHPVDTFRRKWPPHAVPYVCTALRCNCRWRLRKSSLIPRVLVETAKLDRFAYTHTHTHTQTWTQFESQPILEGECPFCPWPPGQNTNSWLVAEACNGNKSQRTPPKHIHTVTHRPAPLAYSCTPRQIASLYVLWQDSSPFFHQSAISSAVSTSSALGPISTGLMVDVGPFYTSNRWIDRSLHLLFMLPYYFLSWYGLLGSLSLPLDTFWLWQFLLTHSARSSASWFSSHRPRCVLDTAVSTSDPQ